MLYKLHVLWRTFIVLTLIKFRCFDASRNLKLYSFHVPTTNKPINLNNKEKTTENASNKDPVSRKVSDSILFSPIVSEDCWRFLVAVIIP